MEKLKDFLGFPVYRISNEERYRAGFKKYMAAADINHKKIMVFEEFSLVPPGEMRNFILAHEVGHILRGHSEGDANAYARSLFGAKGEELQKRCYARTESVRKQVLADLKWQGFLPK